MASKSSEVFKCLKELVKCNHGIYPFKEVLRRSDNFLTIVSTIGVKTLKEEKPNAGTLISKALTAIEFNINCTRYCPRHLRNIEVSKKRRALQYLIDEYADCPFGSTTLAAKCVLLNWILDSIEGDILTDSSDETEGFERKQTNLSKLSDLIKCLKELRDCGCIIYTTEDKYLERADKFLTLVAALGTKQLTKEGKGEIGPLLAESLDPITFNIRCTIYYPNHWVCITASEKRRALQYLIDDYSDCPVGSTTLAAKLKEINIRNLIEMLDRIKDAKWVPHETEDFCELSYLNISDKSSELIKCLKGLVKYKYGIYFLNEIHARSEKFLLLIHAIHTEQLSLKKEDKLQVGLLISEVLPAIHCNITATVSFRTFWMRETALEKRYALQYLLDYYSDCPVGSATLAAKFKEINIKELIEMLDDIKDEKYVVTDESDYEDNCDSSDTIVNI